MASPDSRNVATRATQLYETKLREQLESSHANAFVAIEPDSGEHFLGTTLSEAIQAARRAHPDRLSFALRVGQASAVNIGLSIA